MSLLSTPGNFIWENRSPLSWPSFPILAAVLVISIRSLDANASSDITLDSVAYGMISDGSCFGVSGVVRDGDPDCLTLDFYAVLNRVPPDQEERALAEFDISRLTEDVLSATLISGPSRFHSSGIRELELYGRAGDGHISLSDFYVSKSEYLGSFINGVEEEWSFDVTLLIKDLVSSGEDHVGFVLLKPQMAPGRKIWDGPQLTIENVPEPKALGIGLCLTTVWYVLIKRSRSESKDLAAR